MMKLMKDLCHLLIETADNAILVLKQEQIIALNATAAALFGASKADLHDRTLLDLSPERQPDGQPSLKVWQSHLASMPADQHKRFTWQYQRDNGELFQAYVSLNGLEFEGETYVQVSLQDERLEDQLLEEAHTFRQLAENSGQGLVVMTLKGEIFYLNHSACRLLENDTPKQIIGQPFEQVYPSVYRRRWQNEVLPMVLSEGYWFGESVVNSMKGRATPVLENFFLIEDSHGHPHYIANALTDITEQKLNEAELEARLQQVSALQKLMSQEGWDAFLDNYETQSEGYFFDQSGIQPLSTTMHPEDKPAVVRPLNLQGEALGQFGIYIDDEATLTPEEQVFLDTITGQISEALERARLFEKNRQALEDTEKLYEISAALNTAQSYEEIIATFQEYTILGYNFHHISLDIFDHPWTLSETPGWIEVLVRQFADEISEAALKALPLHYALKDYPSISTVLSASSPTIIEDIRADPSLGDDIKSLYLEQFGAESTIIVPLVVHGQWIGYINATYRQKMTFPEEEIRRINVMAGQAAVAIQNLKNLEFAQEQTVEALRSREEAELMYNTGTWLNRAVDVEDVLRAAASAAMSNGAANASLYAFEVDIQGNPEWAELISEWADLDNAGLPTVPLGTRYDLKNFSFSQIWLANPYTPTLIDDVETDDQLDPATKQAFFEAGIKASIIIPLALGKTWLGLITINWDEPYTFGPRDQRLHSSVASQASITLNNLRLVEESRERTAELEDVAREALESREESDLLYRVGADLNAARTEMDILQAIASPARTGGMHSATLYHFDLNSYGEPEWAELVAAWRPQGESQVSVGLRYVVESFPFVNLILANPDSPILVSDIYEDDRIDASTREFFLNVESFAFTIIPLTLAGEWIGLALLSWDHPHPFTETDQRLYRSISAQAAVVLNNLKLITESQERADQLEKSTQIQTALSQAEGEEGLITAASLSVDDTQSMRATLYYIEIDERGRPETIALVALWQNGAVTAYDPRSVETQEIANHPLAQFMIRQRDQIVFVADMDEDEYVEPSLRDFARQHNFRAIVAIPLYSGRRWHGILTYQWSSPYQFSRTERTTLQQIMEPLSAIVAGRRANLAQQKSLAMSETLYRLGRQMTDIETLSDVVNTLVRELPITVVDQIWLLLFDLDGLGGVDMVTVAAAWNRNLEAAPLNTQYPKGTLEPISIMLSPTPVFINDVQTDSLLSPTTREFFRNRDIHALAVFPLITGTRQQGSLVLQSTKIHEFSEEEVRPYLSLAPQIATTINNRRLFDEMQEALGDVERTQRRYTLQSWEDYRARTPRRFFEHVREGIMPMGDELPPEVGEAIEQEKRVIVKNNNYLEAESGTSDPGETGSSLITPLTLRDEIIGVLGLQETGNQREWTPEEIALVEAIGEQLAQTAESLRLLDETQQRASREQRVNEIGEKIDSAQSIEEALQIALRELGQSLQAEEVAVKLEINED